MANDTIWTIAAGVVSLAGGAFIGKSYEKSKAKKIEAEAESIVVATAEKAIQLWERLNGELNTELNELKNQVGLMKQENKKLHQENMELKRQINTLQSEVETLKKMLK